MRRNRGFILITTTLVLLALSVTLVGATFSFSLGSTDRVRALEGGGAALSRAEGCMEESLFRIRDDADFSNTTIDLEGVECTVRVERIGNDYAVSTEVTSDDYTRRVIVEVNRGPSRIMLSSWMVE